MKRFLIVFLAVIALSIGTVITAEPFMAKAATVKLNKTEVTLDVGDKVKIKVKNSKKKVKWKSDNKNVAKVTKKGNVTAISAGECTITAKVGKKTLTCKVTVTDSVLELLDDTVTIKDVDLPISSVWEFSGAVKTSQIYQYSLGSDVFKWICAEVADLNEGEAEGITSSEESFLEACDIVAASFMKEFDTEQAASEVIYTDEGYLGRMAGSCVSNGNDISVIIYIRVTGNKLILVMGMEIGETDPYTERIVKSICTGSKVLVEE